MYKIIFSLLCLISFSSVTIAMDYEEYTTGEMAQARILGQSSRTLKELHSEKKNSWLSLTDETDTYKDKEHTKHALVSVKEYPLSNNNWIGEIGLFDYLSPIYKIAGFHHVLGKACKTVILFTYHPSAQESSQIPYVTLFDATIANEQESKSCDQITRYFINFVKKHTDAEFIFSDASYKTIGQYILTKPEFGFQNAKENGDLVSYIKKMETPYYLVIKR